ncbi:MAG: response regulator [Ignavibacteriales bacterium]|nr:response regulator [Ignavibacteriales bacterium]
MAKALVIDSDMRSRRIIAKLLSERHGYDVVQSENGRKAFPQVVSHKPDLIFLDVTLPSYDGLKLLEQIRANQALREIPVVALSATTESSFLTKLEQIGVPNVVRKPYDSHKTVEQLRTVVEEYKRQDDLETIAQNAKPSSGPKHQIHKQPVVTVQGRYKEVFELMRGRCKLDIENAIWRAFRNVAADEIRLVKLRTKREMPENALYTILAEDVKQKGQPYTFRFMGSDNGIRRTVSNMEGGMLKKIDEGPLETIKEVFTEAVKEIGEAMYTRGSQFTPKKIIMERHVEDFPQEGNQTPLTFMNSFGEVFYFGSWAGWPEGEEPEEKAED